MEAASRAPSVTTAAGAPAEGRPDIAQHSPQCVDGEGKPGVVRHRERRLAVEGDLACGPAEARPDRQDARRGQDNRGAIRQRDTGLLTRIRRKTMYGLRTIAIGSHNREGNDGDARCQRTRNEESRP
jgi:hypothetical protein